MIQYHNSIHRLQKIQYFLAYKTHFFHLKICLKMECVLYAGASYTPKNVGNFDLSKSTLFVYVGWYVRVNCRACVFSTCSRVGF
jgi:hypothetical protein